MMRRLAALTRLPRPRRRRCFCGARFHHMAQLADHLASPAHYNAEVTQHIEMGWRP